MTGPALPTPTVPTARLRLRPFGDPDAGDLFALQSNAHVLRYWDGPPWTEPERLVRLTETRQGNDGGRGTFRQ